LHRRAGDIYLNDLRKG